MNFSSSSSTPLMCFDQKKAESSFVLIWLLRLNLQYDFTLYALVFTVTHADKAWAAVTQSGIMKSQPHLLVVCFSLISCCFQPHILFWTPRGDHNVKGDLYLIVIGLKYLSHTVPPIPGSTVKANKILRLFDCIVQM